MVSPSKTKLSRVAASSQQKTASSNKVKLVKGPRPLVNHRFYLDIQKHQLARKIEVTIKELGGKIEFILNKEITHFVTDRDIQQVSASQQQQPQPQGTDFDGGPSNYQFYQQQQPQQQQPSPATPTTPLTPRTPLSHPYHPHHLQYVNEASPSSPCLSGIGPASASGSTAAAGAAVTRTPAKHSAGSECKGKPLSRADAMLQRVRQQNQQNSPTAASSYLSARSAPGSPCSPSPIAFSTTPANNNSNSLRIDRDSLSPTQLAKSWGKPIWSTEYAIKFLKKVIDTCNSPQDNAVLAKQAGGNTTTRKGVHPQHLRGHFVKIESTTRHYRPAFQLFKKWPALNLNVKGGGCAFATERETSGAPSAVVNVAAPVQPESAKTTTATTNATTKLQTQQQQQCGYCEICRIEYDVLVNHLNTEEHKAFVSDDKNFVNLDKLIGDSGVDLLSFINANQTFEEETVDPAQEETDNNVEKGCGSDTSEKDAPLVEEECKPEQVEKAFEEKDDEEPKQEEEVPIAVLKVTKSYTRSGKSGKHLQTIAPDSGAQESTEQSSPPAKRTYAGRRPPKRRATSAAAAAEASNAPEAPAVEVEPSAVPSPPSITAVADTQMFGRRSAIYHHPHNTLNHHNHQKVKTAKLVQQAIINSAINSVAAAAPASAPPPPPPTSSSSAPRNIKLRELVVAVSNSPAAAAKALSRNPPSLAAVEQSPAAAAAPAAIAETTKQTEKAKLPDQEEPAVAVAANEMKVLNDSSAANNEKEKERNSKRSAADRMGLKGSTIKPVSHPVELMECEGLDPKNTKRISLGLRQNPKRANLNEDFTSLLDETLGPMRKPRVRRESAKRVNYSEPRDDEIVSQEDILVKSILESSAKEANESKKKKAAGSSPKRTADVKIRGIQWRAPSPQARPPVKSPLLYKVIEDPKPKSKKASPTKDTTGGTGSPSKSNKNGLIVKIRRVRQSELSLLNDEAENFMFPKKDESSEEDTDEDRHTTSETGPGDFSQEILSSDYDQRNSSMRRSAGTPAPGNRKRAASVGRVLVDTPSRKLAKESDQDAHSTPTGRGKRACHRGVAALLQDNAEYYKFPDPGSRLRFPEAPIQPGPEVEDESTVRSSAGGNPPKQRRGKKRFRAGISPAADVPVTPSCAEKQQQDLLLATRSSTGSPYRHQEQLSNCGKTIINYVKGKEDGMGVFRWSNFKKNCEQIEPYRFAFERVPSLEPWYEAFQRQDESTEKLYEYFGNTAYRKLPFEMGPLPPLKDNCCILNYHAKAKTPEASAVPTTTTTGGSSTSGNSSASSSSDCCGTTSNTNCTTTATPSANAITNVTASTATTPSACTKDSLEESKLSLSLPLKKRKLLVEERPRKSPREHASTLAILSLLHQETQHNRRRTISGSSNSGIPYVTTLLPPPSPAYSPKKLAIQQQQQQQEGDSALGDEIRSSCGSDPITEKEASSDLGITKRIKFEPPVLEDSYINYKVMCQELDQFLSVNGSVDDEVLFDELPISAPSEVKTVPIGSVSRSAPSQKDLADILRTCDKEPPLTLKQVKRHESIVRKIVQYDRKPRPLSAISVKSFDGGGSVCLFRKRINRTGWPNVKKRIVTRKQQLLLKVKKENETDDAGNKKGDEPSDEVDGSRKSSTEESQLSGITIDDKIKLEDEDDEEEDDEDDEFEDTVTMLDDDDATVKMDQLLTEDEEEPEASYKAPADPPRTPVPTKLEETPVPTRFLTRPLPSSKYVTKTTTTMTRVDYNVPVSSSSSNTNNNSTAPAVSTVASTSEDNTRTKLSNSAANNNASSGNGTVVCPPTISTLVSATAATTGHHNEDDDKECDSISSRSIFVSDDCDTTSSTLINMCTDDSPVIATPAGALCTTTGSQRNSATPQPITLADESTTTDRPVSQARVHNSRSNSKRSHAAISSSQVPATNCSNGNSDSGKATMQPVICIERLNCSTMRTRSASRTPVRTYKRSAFVNTSGKPLKRKRKRKKHKINGTGSTAPSVGTASPTSCSEEVHSVSSSLECEESAQADEPLPVPRKSIKDRPPTPGPLKFSPRKLRKPRGRWYRER